jgi:hypothetical protein
MKIEIISVKNFPISAFPQSVEQFFGCFLEAGGSTEKA